MKDELKQLNSFGERHIGPRQEDLPKMLKTIGVESLDKLIEETIPSDIVLKEGLNIPEAINENEFLTALLETARMNKTFKSFIGLGYNDCIIPSVIRRNIFENPGWYTQYTPYQAEIAQGRLEGLLIFQTMVSDLTGMEVANASLLDEATAAAEAMTMSYRLRDKDLIQRNANVFFVSDKCFPQTIDVLKTRSEPIGIELEIGDINQFKLHDKVFGAMIQYPDAEGKVKDITDFVADIHRNRALAAVSTDLLSLTLLTPPGELGADIVVGSAQRFGVPLGYGGPHAAFFAARDEYKRQMPGRIIGVSVDMHGKDAYRMALQTREQHIRREKATSNICTAQALLAIMAGMYAIYHGPRGLHRIGARVHSFTQILDTAISELGYHQENDHYFDTLKVKVTPQQLEIIKNTALAAGVNFRYVDSEHIGIALDETINKNYLSQIVEIFARGVNKPVPSLNFDFEAGKMNFPRNLARQSGYLTHPVFNSYHSETKMMRYIKKLENRDLSLTFSMIPLGSCTMKLNAASEMIPLGWSGFSKLHPFVPQDQAPGYAQVFRELESLLCEITGFDAVSFQPNSGAQGEYTSLLIIRAYHKDRGDSQRNVVLIPSSAHGTNPASASMAGMKVVIVKCEEDGDIDVEDLRTRAIEFKDTLAAIMVTYPSTHGVYEARIRDICKIVHENGGQVFMDGANMNAQVGLTNPAIIGADICHLNLHKTFSIPHGGGGPGMGPICMAKHLAPFMPKHPIITVGGEKGITAVSAAPWSSASILVISYGYIRMLGARGVTDASKYAILNANYIKSRLEKHYKILYKGKHGRAAHEMIFDLREFKSTANVEVEDVAKRLIDYGFHAPTVSFPVIGTMMVEPTESESMDELDRFCDALISIREEIQEIEKGKADKQNNVLKNAPHTVEVATADEWKYPYPRAKAVYPLAYVQENKFWPPVGRIDNVYGDRNLVCACPPIDSYESGND
jgi:glycine dehydrogenase